MATGGCEVPCCFSKQIRTCLPKKDSCLHTRQPTAMNNGKDYMTIFGKGMSMPVQHAAPEDAPATGNEEKAGRYLPDFTNIDEVRRAFIASEIFNRKY